MPAESNLVTFRALPEHIVELESRRDGKPLGAVARRDLERYWYALRVELQAIRLTESEAMLVLDALNGVLHEAHTMQLLWASVADAIRLAGLDEKWAVDGDALVAKLQDLTYTQALAVIDACDRWWQRQGQEESREQSLKGVGLVR